MRGWEAMTYNRWSTLHIPPPQRVEFWHEAMHRAHMGATPHIPQPDQFEGTLISRGVGSIVLNRIQMEAGNYVERLGSDMDRSGPPSLLVHLYLQGSALVSLQGPAGTRGLQMPPGQPFLLDERHSYRLTHGGPAEMLVLAVPLALLDMRREAIQSLLACRLVPSASLQLLTQQMHLLGQWTHELPLAEATLLSDLVTSTMRAVVHAGSRVSEATERTQGFLLQRVRQLIARQYPDPRLGPAEVAHGLGMPVRTLQSHLARAGTSLSAELMAYRLERAHAMLCGAGANKIAIMDVSRRCGFSSPAHFSRRFRERFGGSPMRMLRKK